MTPGLLAFDSRSFTCLSPHVDRCSKPLPWDPLGSLEKDESAREEGQSEADEMDDAPAGTEDVKMEVKEEEGQEEEPDGDLTITSPTTLSDNH